MAATTTPTATTRHPLGTAAVVLAVWAWGFGPVLVKAIDLDGLTVGLYRVWLGAGVMGLVLLAARTPLTVRHVKVAAVSGLLFGVNIAMFFNAVKKTSIANASLISTLSPLLILVVAGPWFGERVTRRDVGLAALVLAGVAIVILGSSERPEWSPVGDALAVGALITFTGYFLATKRARAEMGTLEYQTIVMAVAALVITPITFVAGAAVELPEGEDWLWLVLFVLVPGAGGHLLMSWSQRYVDVSVSSVITVAQPVVSASVAAVALGESLGPLQVAGGTVVLAGIAAVVQRHRRLEAELVADPTAEATSK